MYQERARRSGLRAGVRVLGLFLLHGNCRPLRGRARDVLHRLGEDRNEEKENVKIEVPSRRGQGLEFLDKSCPSVGLSRFGLWTHNTSYIAQ